MDPSALPTSHRCLPRGFADRNGLSVEIHRLATTGGQRLIDMYLAFQPRNSFQGLPPIKDEVCVRWVREILVTGIHLIATQKNEQPIVGHAALFPVNREKCEMLVVVCPGFQNLGIGTEMVRSCIDLAGELGFQQIWLPVDATNVRARHVYRKCGFEYVSNKQGRELDMTCDVRSADSHVGAAVALPPQETAANSERQCNCHSNIQHAPAPHVPASCFRFPALPQVAAGR
jgi:RimJ/RimL family protein N-acetyltransferase